MSPLPGGPVFTAATSPRVEILRLGSDGPPALLIDGLLDGAPALIDFAAEIAVLAPVRAAANFYPGVRAPAPGGYVEALVRTLRPYLAETFGVPVDGRAKVTSALSMAILPASAASLAQRLPHIDGPDPHQLAILHYLCGPEHGGTAFYRHRSTGLEVIDPAHAPAYAAALREERTTAEIGPGYIRGSNALFEQTAVVDPAFNRIVVYGGNRLHAGLLLDQPLSSDPRRGRLTVNSFFRFEARGA